LAQEVMKRFAYKLVSNTVSLFVLHGHSKTPFRSLVSAQSNIEPAQGAAFTALGPSRSLFTLQ
jgi:hypothetical protein